MSQEVRYINIKNLVLWTKTLETLSMKMQQIKKLLIEL